MAALYRRSTLALLLLAALVSRGGERLRAQEPAEPVLSGRVLLGDTVLMTGTVVLHHIGQDTQGEVDSTMVRGDGTFRLRLPGVPDPGLEEMYFASIRHAGVMYFGGAITIPIQLDSLYEIQAYDTLLAPDEGVDFAVQARNIFFETAGETWQVTDVFQLRNDRDRTVVPRGGGRVWSYPLPEGAADVVTSEGEMSADVASYEDGRFVVRAAMPPGERLFIVRYTLGLPEVSIPTPGETELFDVLVREPAPPLRVEGLAQVESVEVDVGQTFRRFAAENVVMPFLSIGEGEESSPPPVEWIAVVLALILAAGGVVALRGAGGRAAPAPLGRREILMEIARLDEAFERSGSPSRAERRAYQGRREELLTLLRARE